MEHIGPHTHTSFVDTNTHASTSTCSEAHTDYTIYQWPYFFFRWNLSVVLTNNNVQQGYWRWMQLPMSRQE